MARMRHTRHSKLCSDARGACESDKGRVAGACPGFVRQEEAPKSACLPQLFGCVLRVHRAKPTSCD
jgi:hypothetical protein